MERAALRQPLLVCHDDVQWADASCGFALRMVTQWLASLPVGLADRDPAEPGTTADPPGAGGVDRRRRRHYRPDAAGCFGGRGSGGRTYWAPRRGVTSSGPSPACTATRSLSLFFAGLREENLVYLVDGRADWRDNRVPHRLEDSMRRRLSRTSPAAERIVTVGCISRSPVHAQPGGGDGRFPVADLVDPVREVIDAGILIEVGGRLAFQHDLAREAVRSAVPDAVRRALDREAADVLLAAGALPVEVAAQLAESAEPGEVTAVRALAQAAESLGMTDPSASADIASVALSLAPSRHPLRGPLVARRTVSLFAAGRSEEARAFADHALRQSLPAEQEADVRLSLAAMFAISADDRADNARQGLSLAGPPPPRGHGCRLRSFTTCWSPAVSTRV